MFHGGLFNRIIEDVDVFVIAAQLVVIEAEAHDEAVLDLHGHVIKFQVLLVHIGFEQHGADLHVRSAGIEQEGVEVGDGLAGVNDVFYDNHRAAFDGGGEAQYLAGNARGECAFIG